MKLTWSWLSEVISTSFTPEEIVACLTRSGTETTLGSAYPWVEGLTVAEVLDCQPHPQSDHLTICRVKYSPREKTSCNEEEVQVVCGAANVRPGLKTILAKPGQILPGCGDPLEKAVLRGVESYGMLCSIEEIGVRDLIFSEYLVGSSFQDGLIELHPEVSVGTPLEAFLPRDWVLDCEITANRGDLMSVLGIARELVGLGVAQFKSDPFFKKDPFLSFDPAQNVTVTSSDCTQLHFFSGTLEAPYTSPMFVKQRLWSVGQSTVIPLVDAANYWSHMYGFPLHVFDRRSLKGKLELCAPSAGESFLALNGKNYALTSSDLVLRDEEGVLSLVGVMGGERGKCQEDSQSILIEAGVFSPLCIGLTGQRTKITSQARMRFERGVDEARVAEALEGFVRFFGGKGTFTTGRAACAPLSKSIGFSTVDLKKKTDVSLSILEAENRLMRLGCGVERNHDQGSSCDRLVVTPPTWRHDISIPEDLIEEILRVEGYEGVPVKLDIGEISLHPLSLIQRRGWQARKFLTENGMFDVVTWSFLSMDQAQNFWDGDPKVLESMRIMNPIAKELSVMRPSIIPQLCDLAVWHKDRNIFFDPVFEVGPSFFGDQPGEQKEVLAGFVPMERRPYWGGCQKVSFYDVRALLEGVFQKWALGNVAYQEQGPSWVHPWQSARLLCGEQPIGYVGRLHPRLACKCDGWVFEIDISSCPEPEKTAFKLWDLQAVAKDLSFFFKKERPVGPFLEGLKKACPDVTEVWLMDIFENEDQPRSITVRCLFQPEEASFSALQLREKMEQLVQWAQSQNVALRGTLVV